MYANQRYQPPHRRGVSFGAALALNAAIIAGLVYSAPKFMPKHPIGTIDTWNVPTDVPPPPKPEEQPKPVKRTTAATPQPVAPKPIVDSTVRNPVETTDIIPPTLPPVDLVAKPGPIATPELLKVLPPLVAAAQDPRFARDFQPEYPSAELRAQRDGQVSIRVLIGVDGRVKAVQQISATSTAFFEATKRQALGKWRFKPASRGGVPEESWKSMNVRFELENAR